MGLRAVIQHPSFNPEQKALRKRRLQLLAIRDWLDDLNDGQDEISLFAYCRARGVAYTGIQRMLRSPQVQDLIDGQLKRTGRQVAKLSSSLLLKKLEQEGELMKVRDLVQAGEHGAKLAAAAYGKPETGVQVAVQVNLPDMGQRTVEARVEAVKGAREELDGYV